MKKYIILLTTFFLSFAGFSQSKQYIGTASGLVIVRGGIIGDSAIIISEQDTTSHPWRDSVGVLTVFNNVLYMTVPNGSSTKWVGILNTDKVNNGLSINNGIINWGQNLGEPGNPGALLSHRQIPLAGNVIAFTDTYGSTVIRGNEFTLNGDSANSKQAKIQITDVPGAKTMEIVSFPTRAEISYKGSNWLVFNDDQTSMFGDNSTASFGANYKLQVAGGAFYVNDSIRSKRSAKIGDSLVINGNTFGDKFKIHNSGSNIYFLTDDFQPYIFDNSINTSSSVVGANGQFSSFLATGTSTQIANAKLSIRADATTTPHLAMLDDFSGYQSITQFDAENGFINTDNDGGLIYKFGSGVNTPSVVGTNSVVGGYGYFITNGVTPQLRLSNSSTGGIMSATYPGDGTSVYFETTDGSGFNFANWLYSPSLYGSETTGASLEIHSNALSNGKIRWGISNLSAFDEANNRLGIKTATPKQALHVNGQVQIDTVLTGNAVDSFLVIQNGVIKKRVRSDTSGVYTPTLTNTTNVTASTSHPCTFTANATNVTVYGTVTFTNTTSNQLCELGISLPIASNLAAVTDLNGYGIGENSGNGFGNASLGLPIIKADITNDRAVLNVYIAGNGTSGTVYFSFQYQRL